MNKLFVIFCLFVSVTGCRRVSIVSDSLFFIGTLNKFEFNAQGKPVVKETGRMIRAINSMEPQHFFISTPVLASPDNPSSYLEFGGAKYQYFPNIVPGTTAQTNPMYSKIVNQGAVAAFTEATFGTPDSVVFSFATNDMNAVGAGTITYQQAKDNFWFLAHSAVTAGATCIVMVEASHHFRDTVNGGIRNLPGDAAFTARMDLWFNDMVAMEGSRVYNGKAFTFVVADSSGSIADISTEIHRDIDKYIVDYIHLSADGESLVADAMTKALASCP